MYKDIMIFFLPKDTFRLTIKIGRDSHLTFTQEPDEKEETSVPIF